MTLFVIGILRVFSYLNTVYQQSYPSPTFFLCSHTPSKYQFISPAFAHQHLYHPHMRMCNTCHSVSGIFCLSITFSNNMHYAGNDWIVYFYVGENGPFVYISTFSLSTHLFWVAKLTTYFNYHECNSRQEIAVIHLIPLFYFLE